MVTQGLAIQSYYHQQESYAERPEDIPLSDLSHQSSLQSLTNHDDEDDDNSSVRSFELYTPDEEKSLLRKLDTRLVLFLALLYMLSFLDRSNIGNAKVAGLSTSLNLSPAQFEWLLTGFYMSYICFEWMTLLYKIFAPHAYISICVLAWGCLASLQSVSTGFGSMLILRILLGISEAAFGPGVPFYLSFFFKRNELAFRTGLFISAAPLASSFASTLAFAIVKLGKNTAIESWRILFIIEGFPSVLVAVWACMGYSAIKAQGLAAPPHLFAFVVVLVTSVISDRLQSRSIPIIIHASSAMAGWDLFLERDFIQNLMLRLTKKAMPYALASWAWLHCWLQS
ncbi:MFS general substrate transporter, partial [Aureobasidium melanogenum]